MIPMRLRESRIFAWILRILILILFFLKIVQKNRDGLGLLVLTFLLTFYPVLWKRIFDWNFSPPLELSLSVFLFLSHGLGSSYHFYTKFFFWDLFLHTISGCIFYFVGKECLEHMGRHPKSRSIRFTLLICSFFFALSTGVVWEIIEFTTDSFFGTNHQWARGLVGRSALMDTMTDLIALSIGSIITIFFDMLLEGFFPKNKRIR